MESWPAVVGKAILLGDPEYESMTCFDLRRDGSTEVSLELRIPFKSPKGKANELGYVPQFTADVYLLARYERTAAKLNTLLSSLRIYGEGSAESYMQGSGIDSLLGAVDIDRDGAAELVLATSNGIRVYKPTPTGLLLICEVRNYRTIYDY